MPPARRIVHHGDAIAWLGEQGRIEGASVVTSLPDWSELRGTCLEDWKGWFVDAAALCMSATSDDGVAVFFQTDIRHEGLWIDKGDLIMSAARQADMGLLSHRIVCRAPAGTATQGRASYAHLLSFVRGTEHPLRSDRTRRADVIADGGEVPGARAMGVNACVEACRLVQATDARIVVDPFCGWGTVLAVANAMGLSAIGVDRSKRMCDSAQTLEVVLPADGKPEPPAPEVVLS